MFHAIFLFDYVKFRQEAQSFVELADEGEYAAIINKAKEIETEIVPEKWILEDLGTTLKGFTEFQQKGMSAQVVGFSFLILLSQYLEEISLTNLGVENVAQAVASLGWAKADVDLLSQGMSPTVLLKPSFVNDVLERPSTDDSRWYDPAYYWWWVRPENAFYIGWWDKEHLEKLQNMLSEVQDTFEQVDIGKLNLHSSVTKKTLVENYHQTMKLLKLAEEHKCGLLSITR
jgi:hypothetical protein